ncbi:hypothetical protein IA539_04620 [Gordonia sp. zg691]|uniref:hypothetical protein n=1 Tax=Gordonia jinghuaiqii TaxID=2758710 RepID=UPI0016627F2B|nr:hypothetical protein [Gordonia jinghuaiqii]MBD0860491.1 hypothetical protein [Gordonia jinghuaiqii]
MKKFTQSLLLVLLGAALVSSLCVGVSDARPLGANGRPPGTASSPGVAQCKYKPAWSTLQLSIGGPTVRTNRVVRVRYTLLAQNAGNRAGVAAVASPFVTVRPGRPFTFGPGNIQVHWRQNVHLYTLVEFATGARTMPTIAFVADRYQYFNGNNVGPIGPFRSCYRA